MRLAVMYLAVDGRRGADVAHSVDELVDRRDFDAAVEREDVAHALGQDRLVPERTVGQIGHERVESPVALAGHRVRQAAEEPVSVAIELHLHGASKKLDISQI